MHEKDDVGKCIDRAQLASPQRKMGAMSGDSRDEGPENESHKELEGLVEVGVAAILSDEALPGGRFQEVAVVQGGALVIAQWRQDAAGDWRSPQCIILQRGTVPRLGELLRRNGYQVMPVDPGVARA